MVSGVAVPDLKPIKQPRTDAHSNLAVCDLISVSMRKEPSVEYTSPGWGFWSACYFGHSRPPNPMQARMKYCVWYGAWRFPHILLGFSFYTTACSFPWFGSEHAPLGCPINLLPLFKRIRHKINSLSHYEILIFGPLNISKVPYIHINGEKSRFSQRSRLSCFPNWLSHIGLASNLWVGFPVWLWRSNGWENGFPSCGLP